MSSDPIHYSFTHPSESPILKPDQSFLDQDDSDYGDLGNDEEELGIIQHLLNEIDSQQVQAPLLVTDIEDYEPPKGVRLPKVIGVEQPPWRRQETAPPVAGPSHALSDVQDPDPEKPPAIEELKKAETEQPIQAEAEAVGPDNRSPLERFRRPPKKALSVTDLVSPAWCELQYFYVLAKHGKRRKTPAMKQGTAVHRALEDEVHTIVEVNITKKEDSWGLRIWNIIQGLRTLRDTGRTREIEVWGMIGGEVVNGCIDELSYTCPDAKLEAKVNKTERKKQEVILPEYQSSIMEYLLAPAQEEDGKSISDSLTGPRSPVPSPRQRRSEKRIYITDVKTRGVSTLPTGSSLLPTILQLHLYHHMLENFAQGNFPLDRLTDRYDLDPKETFSDSFIAQVGGLNQDLFDTFSSSPEASMQVLSSQDSMDILLRHSNLSALWDFMLSEFRQTFFFSPFASGDNSTPSPTPQSISDLPNSASQPTRLSPVLTAQYLSPSYKHNPKPGQSLPKPAVIGHKSFLFDPDFLKSYLTNSLAWWRGERPPRGVELAEAWKCRTCDFRYDCYWIFERDEAAVREALERRRMREEAAGDVDHQGKSKSRV